MNVLIVIPAHNEEAIIEQNLRRVFDVLPTILSPNEWRVLVAENGSTDQTASIVRSLLPCFPNLRLSSFDSAGKGHAIRTAWQEKEADVYAFMDADLSAELSHLPRLLEALHDADIAIGSRRHPQAKVSRSLKREILSRAYNAAARRLLHLPFLDLQCGFKAVRRHVVADLLPKTEHDGYFFDTELLALAHHEDYQIAEVPIAWQETLAPGRKSRVKLGRTSWELFRNILSLRTRIRTLTS